MSIPGSANALLLASTAAAAGGYQVSRSLRFNSSDSAYLSRTPAVAGNRRTFTWAGWIKRCKLGSRQSIFSAGTGNLSGDPGGGFFFNSTTDTLSVVHGGATSANLTTAQVFRDVSAWFHLVVAYDTTQGTPSNSTKIYVNGSQVTISGTYLSSNFQTDFNNTVIHGVGTRTDDGPLPASTGDFYLADIHFIDGQQLTPSSFTEVSATTGQLIPKAYTGGYGTNGFRLDFSNPFDLGNDAAGTNDWTPNNLSGVSGGPTSVAAASGALPVYNTTDTYGTVKGTGTRTDSNSSSIVLAIPMDGANNGTTFTDESATIKGSGSAKSITRNGDTKTVTSQSKYYGSSGYFDGTGDYLSLAANADFNLGNVWTIETWYYLTQNYQNIFDINYENFQLYHQNNGSGYEWFCDIRNDQTSSNQSANSGAGTSNLNQWNHVALVSDGTNFKLYVNGVAAGNSGNATVINVNVTTNSYPIWIGRRATSGGGSDGYYVNGYLQDYRIYKGVAKYTSNFNPPSSTQNPTIGAGNDSLVDTPTSFGTDTGVGNEVRGNYCTWNPLGTAGPASSNGNLDIASSSTAGNKIGTILLTSGKWYWECVGDGYAGAVVGVGGEGFTGSTSSAGSKAIGYWFGGGIYWDGGSFTSGIASYTTSDVIGIAVDMTAGTVAFYKNNSLVYTATFGSGTVPNLSSGVYPGFNTGNPGGSARTVVANFGQRAFAYTAPSGFKALCDTNLGAPLVAKPNTLMDVVLWTGSNTATARTISGLQFSPDLVWAKSRSLAYSHNFYDTVRGTGKGLYSDSTSAESTNNPYGYVSAFTSDGFTGTPGSTDNGFFNETSATYVAWAWDAGTTTASNPDGSITSQVRANVSAGFSVVTWTGNNTNGATVGHGLGVIPSFVIYKTRDSSTNWVVNVTPITGTGKYLNLNGTTALFINAQYVLPTSSTLVLPSYGDTNGGSMIAYCFAPVVGYSSMGSYVGNGSSDGPAIWLGFRPRFLIFKKTSSSGRNWLMLDSTRSSYNPVSNRLYADASAAEDTANVIDFTSSGFKIVSTTSDLNDSSGTYIYAAFAEAPFQYARAR